MNLKINNRFSTELPADTNESNTARQVQNACFSYVIPRIPSNTELIHYSDEVLVILGITKEEAKSAEFAKNLQDETKALRDSLVSSMPQFNESLKAKLSSI